MIKINNSTVDLILQVEEHTNIKKVFNELSLDINEVLIICPNIFLERFIQYNEEQLSNDVLDKINKSLEDNNTFISISLSYKQKSFIFNFILYSKEKHIIDNPFKGEQVFNIGFKKIII